MSSPLEDIRVIDLTDDSGRFATKLLAELGADVIRVTTGGSPGQPMVHPDGDYCGGVLDWWYDGGKRRHTIDLDTEAGREAYRQLASVADLIVETERPGRLSALGIDHEHLQALNPALVQISITPFGRSGPRSGWVSSDLVSAAMGGFLSITGLPDRPLNVWGRQAYNYAGFIGAICALAGVRAAHRDGRGRHADISIHETLTGSIENTVMQWFFDDLLPIPKIAARQGALHWLRMYDLAACATGYVMITPAPDTNLLIDWMIEDGVTGIAEMKEVETTPAVGRIDEIMGKVREWVARFDAGDLWWEAQQRHVAFGSVHDIASVAAIPQFEHRQFFLAADNGTGEVRQPGRMVRFSDTPSQPPRPPAFEDTALDEILAHWSARKRSPSTGESDQLPLAGIRIADFTWVLAGPFCTRMLGDLGADVIRIQNEEHSTLVNQPAFPYYFVWNRSKRSATLDMKHPKALATIRRLLEQCDVLIENYSTGVLNSWGLDWETVHAWNPRLVYVSMSGCGHDGPWHKVISYAPTIHALCGITHLTNFPDRGDVGAGFSLNDHLAGFAATVTLLAALHSRERTGRGQLIDMSQLEIGTYAIGPALLDYLSNERESQPAGNRDGLHDHVPNEVYLCEDGEYLAISVTKDQQWNKLVEVVAADSLQDESLITEATRRQRRDEIDAVLREWTLRRSAEDSMVMLQAAGVPAGKVQHTGDHAESDPQLRSRHFWQTVQHEVFGERVTDTFPAMWDGKRLPFDRLSPAYLGEHNFEVWTQLAGLTSDQVAEAMADGLFS